MTHSSHSVTAPCAGGRVEWRVRMGATHFLMKTLSKVATEMALHVFPYNLTRVMNIVGVKPLPVAIRA
jgi:hypothetical protein